MKGKAKPVRAFLLGAIVGEQVVDTGRRAPVRRARAELAAARSDAWPERPRGAGRLVEIVGEPGSGKSRLVEELRGRGRRDAPADVHVPALRLVHRLPRGPPAAPRAPGPAGRGGRRHRGRAVPRRRWRERAPGVLPWAPLIARAIGLPVPDTDETRELDEEFRRPRLAQAVLDLLAGLLPASGLLCVDDAHFMDEASADLFGSPGRGGRAHLVADLHRPPRPSTPASWHPRDAPPHRARPAGPGRRPRAGAPGDRRTRPVPAGSSTPWSTGRRGNPLFLRELLAAALARRRRRPPAGHHRRGGGGPHRQSVERRPLPAPQLSVLGPVVPGRPGPRRPRRAARTRRDPVWRRLDEFVSGDGGDRRASATGCCATAPTTGCRSASGGASTSRPADALPGRASSGRDPSPSSSRSTTSTPSASRRPGSSRSRPPCGPRASTPTSRPPSSTSGPSRPGDGSATLTPVELASVHEELGDARSKAGRLRGRRCRLPGGTATGPAATRWPRPGSCSSWPRCRAGSTGTRRRSGGSPRRSGLLEAVPGTGPRRSDCGPGC